MKVGLPILANTAAFGAVLSLDRVLILWRVPDGDRAAGLYTIAIMGTSWSLDLAGRIVAVLYTYFQTTLGRTSDPAEVARQAIRATEAQAPLLAAGGAVAYLVGPVFLGHPDAPLRRRPPRAPALAAGDAPARPGLARPADADRGRPPLPPGPGHAARPGRRTAVAGAIGADRAGIVGVAWGMTIGYAAVAWLTGAAACVPALGWRPGGPHQAPAGPDPGRIRARDASRPMCRSGSRPMARLRRPLPDPRRLAPADALVLGKAARVGRVPGRRFGRGDCDGRPL